MKGEILKKLRKERHLTQEQVAKAVNVSTSLIRMMELDQRNGSINVINSLADFFGVSVDFLQGKEENEIQNTKRINSVNNLLNRLVEKKIITNIDDVDEVIEGMIVLAAKMELEEKLKKKNDEQ